MTHVPGVRIPVRTRHDDAIVTLLDDRAGAV